MKNILRAMRLDLSALLLLTLVLVFSGCSGGDAKSSKKLYIFNWTYYTPDSVIEKFEKEYGVDVVYDSFASNEEMFAKLKAGGANYDLCFPSGDYVSIMIHEEMLQKIDHAALKNYGNIAPEVLEKSDFDPGNEYSIPYYMGAAGVAVNKLKVPQYDKSWAIFAREDLAGKMIMLDDMREVLGDALKYLGYSVNTTNDEEIAKAKTLVNDVWKPNLLKFDAEAFAKNFAAGEVWVAQGYAESIYAELDKSRWGEIDFFIPKEGGPSYIDSMVILKDSKNKDMAMKFIDYIHRPEIYAEFCDAFGFPATANTSARALKKGDSYYTAESLEPCELKKDVGADLEKYNAAWQEIKVGK
ncbi:MAG TPA: spermidine/putrescine ABC transporter substrate-binding protein [Spirochaetaceae bacterium]|nr:spermidine/putrescine ABC transporter substrate-binding protein [Spirochaetaceae bacterium]